MGYAPLVSVIVPVYKTEKFIHRCIDSVLNQTYSNWEMILVDDGSPDACGQICDSYAAKDGRIHVIHQANQGLSAARNAGIKICKGEWIYFLDSDDFIVEDALEKMIFFSKSGTYDIIMAGFSIIYADGSEDCRSSGWKETDDLSEIRRGILLDELPNFAHGKLYKRYLWNDLIFPAGRLVEDMYVSATVFFKAGSAYLTPVSLYRYSYENENSLMRGKNIKDFIQLKYGRFLAWREHERIADLHALSDKKVCCIQALKCAVKTFVADFNTRELPDLDYRELESYIFMHRDVSLPFLFSFQRYLIVSECTILLQLCGYVRKMAVSLQYKMRQWKFMADR